MENFLLFFGFFVFVIGVIIKALLAIIPAKIANGKGHSQNGFYVLGFFFFLIALIISICLPDNSKPPVISVKSVTNTQISNADEIIKYKKLYDEGVITKEEFENKKAQLLK